MSERIIHEIVCQYKYNGWSADVIAKHLDLSVKDVKDTISKHCTE